MILTAVSKPEQRLAWMARPRPPRGLLLWTPSIGLVLLLAVGNMRTCSSEAAASGAI